MYYLITRKLSVGTSCTELRKCRNSVSVFFFAWRNSPYRARPPHHRGFTITIRHSAFGRHPLDD
jgi:hypothetical protein